MRGLPQKQNARRAYKIRLCGHLRRYKKIVKKTYIIYNKFDLVIGGRVHGIGMSASLGIPGIMIKHDSRSSTTDGFLATSINIGTSVNDIVEIIEAKSKNIENESKKLNEHKKETMSKYLEILKERLHD